MRKLNKTQTDWLQIVKEQATSGKLDPEFCLDAYVHDPTVGTYLVETLDKANDLERYLFESFPDDKCQFFKESGNRVFAKRYALNHYWTRQFCSDFEDRHLHTTTCGWEVWEDLALAPAYAKSGKPGRWTFQFDFKDIPRVDMACRWAVESGIVTKCYYTGVEAMLRSGCTVGHCSFYVNADDAKGNSRVVAFLTEYGFLQTARPGVYVADSDNTGE